MALYLYKQLARFAHLLLAPRLCPLQVLLLIAPAFSVLHFVSAKLYCGIINLDSTLVVCSNGRCYFTSNTLISAVETSYRKLDWPKLLGSKVTVYLTDTQLVFVQSIEFQ